MDERTLRRILGRLSKKKLEGVVVCVIYAIFRKDMSFEDACMFGQTEIVRLLMDRVQYDGVIDDGFETACEIGHIEIVRLLLNKVRNYNEGYILACVYGHTEIVRLLLNKVRNYNEGYILACEYGNIEIVRLLLNRVHNYDEGYRAASERGYTEIVNLIENLAISRRTASILSLRNTVLPDDLIGQITINYLETPLIRQALRNKQFYQACSNGQTEIVLTLLNRVHNLDEGLKIARKHGHTEIVDLIVSFLQRNVITHSLQ